MAADEKWYFTKEQLLQSPSRKSGYDVDKELSCRQQAANFIQDMGQRLQVSQLCINTAIVYMHRFYVFHSLASFHRNAIAAAALFLAAKVEEQPRKLEHVIKVAHICLHRENPNLDTKSEVYLEQAQDLVFNENVLLQTLGFDVAIDHPHTHVVRCCHLVRASKDLAQTSYFMASNSLHLTTMCLQYKPTVVACFCIHLACKWSNWEIPRSNEGKDWFWYVDKTVTLELLEQLTGEFLAIFDKCPTKLKRKMMSMNQNNTPGFTQPSIPHDGLQFEEPRKLSGTEAVKPPEGLFPVQKQNSQLPSDKISTSSSASSSSSSASSAIPSHPHHQKIDYREYREKKERERLEREKQHHHHQQQQRDGHSSGPLNSHHHSKGGPVSTKGPPTAQSRTSSSHKSYQQQPHAQQNVHFQNAKENVDSNSGQNYQMSRDSKDNNYLKQQPPNSERDNKDSSYHGQYSQVSNIQHQNYPHKSESGYSHREGSRTNHNNQISGSSSLSQPHHSQSHSSSNPNLTSNQRDFAAISQREGASVKDNSEVQSQPSKKDISSSIRDIIGQTLPQLDSHSMTSERKDIRDKNRANYVYGSMTLPGSRPEMLKNGRDQNAKVFHDSADKKVEDFASRSKDRLFKKEEEEPVIDNKKIEPITPLKAEKYDEPDLTESYSGGTSNSGNCNWNYDFGFNLSNVKSEKKELSSSSKVDATLVKLEVVDKSDPIKSSEIFSTSAEVCTSKSQAVHPMRGIYDSKYKGHHYSLGNKNSDIGQFKGDKQSAQCSSDVTKKFNDRLHEKLRKSECDRVSHVVEAGSASDSLKHHKLNKEMHEKHKVHIEQKVKDRSSPSTYTKVKSVPRPTLECVKPESGHFSLDATGNGGSLESDKNDKTATSSLKVSVSEDSNKGIGSSSNFHKQQKNHEFGSVGGLTSSLSDSNLMKTSKPSSIFSPDSKISPQIIFNSLEKDSKKSNLVSHRTHSSSKASPTLTPVNVRVSVPAPVSVSTVATSQSSVSTGSLFSPPLPKPAQPAAPRHRTSSSGSEPELIPLLTKIDETPGYENIIREKKIAIPSSDKAQNSEREKLVASERAESTSNVLFDFDLRGSAKDKSADSKANLGRNDPSQFAGAKQTSVKLPSEIRSDLGAVIYPNNPKSVAVSKPGQTFSLTEPKLSLANSVSTVNLSGIEKMVDTSISPAKQPNPYGAPSSLKSSLAMNINFNLPVSSGSNTFASVTSGQAAEILEKLPTDQNISKPGAPLTNSEAVDVEDGHSDSKKRSEKKKKKDKHKHKDKDRSDKKKEKKKHKEKDKERVKERDKHRDKERSKDKEKNREKEIDVVNSDTVNSEAPIKITIPKDKISGGFKIKIPKDCLKKEGEMESPKSGTSGELKIKISKDKFSHMGTYKEESKGNSKKRDRSPKSTVNDLPHPKLLKTSDKKVTSSSRSNGTDGSSRNSSSHRHSVSENGSYIDISSLYDFPFDFEEEGEGIIKTPDYDFEALNASEFPQDIITLAEDDESFLKNSQNELETNVSSPVPTSEHKIIEMYPKNLENNDTGMSCEESVAGILHRPPSLTGEVAPKCQQVYEERQSPRRSHAAEPCCNSSPSKSFISDISGGESEAYVKGNREREGNEINPEDYVLKNYRSILDNHSRRCEVQSQKNDKVPVGREEAVHECNSSDSISLSGRKMAGTSFETENPNYYNKYFKREGSTRTRLKDEKKGSKPRLEDKSRYEDRTPRFYDKFDAASQRFRSEYADRRDDHRHYRDLRDYGADSQYYFDSSEGRRFEYQKYLAPNFFNASKSDGKVAAAVNYDINANENSSLYPQGKSTSPFVCDSSITNSLDINLQYQYGYFNNFVYTNGGYRFYGNMPFVNMSLIHQQPTPPGTGDASVHLGPPPLPLEPPPDLPPPPETPPPKHP